MKINKHISIEWDLYDKLKQEDNASELINRLLWEYYGSLKEPAMNQPELLDPITLMNKAEAEARMIRETDEINAMLNKQHEH